MPEPQIEPAEPPTNDPVAAPVAMSVDSSVARGVRGRLQGRLADEFGILAALLVLGALISVLNSRFLDSANLVGLVASSAFYGVMALVMTFVLAIGEIDLSVGSAFYLTAVVTVQLMITGLDPWLAAGAGVLLGAALGIFNGWVSLALRIPVIIVTLGTLSVYRGLGLILSDAQELVINNTTSSFFSIITAKFFEIPIPAILFVVLAIGLHILLHRTRFGYRVLAIGSNPEAARLVGMPSSRTKIAVMALMGAAAGLTGVMEVGYFQAVDTSLATGYELLVISSVIIGGTSLSGGSGTVIGTVIGVLIIEEISSGIVYLGVPATDSTFVTGVVILAAVALDRLIRIRRDRAGWAPVRGALVGGGEAIDDDL